MKSRSPLAVLALTTLLVSCSGNSDNNQAQVPAGQSNAGVTQAPASTNPQSFPNPVASPMAIVGVKAVPGLLQPTNAEARIPTIAAGRRDPFAAVMMPPMSLPAQSKAIGSRSASSQQSLPRLRPVPLPNFSNSQTASLPPVSVAAVPRPGALPPMPIPAAPASRTSLAEAIEVSGALQVGGTWTIIVKEPGSPTSRYVKQGDYLANGQVLVKRIIAGSEPTVVLRQNGIEVTKSVGSSPGPIARS
ncbi:hypothetical protein K9N68_07525 [Kovacikia minuta CCNUW1]|uniref:hypothetical protein n=1 Tax=Kovacikia minuta TaxID=2931930 RepID=UPI001CCCB179|nr:hypothetical protein [Kovacikia minuta]UBF27754.1 hypothetical protein K9N68_07525 [Kovacikia minuta CCNUW1]